jgi:hypothetical protein
MNSIRSELSTLPVVYPNSTFRVWCQILKAEAITLVPNPPPRVQSGHQQYIGYMDFLN